MVSGAVTLQIRGLWQLGSLYSLTLDLAHQHYCGQVEMHAQDSSLNRNLNINKAEVHFIKRKMHALLGICLSVCRCTTFQQCLRREFDSLDLEL